jgi:hypothetical protein
MANDRSCLPCVAAQNRFESLRDEIMDVIAEKCVGSVSRLRRSMRLRERTDGSAPLRRGPTVWARLTAIRARLG